MTEWDRVRTIADAVLYEGYLLYPYRANSRKNQSRFQFGVLGPERAAERGIGEDDTMSAQILLDPKDDATLTIVVRFLQLQRRTAERDAGGGEFEPVDELTAGSRTWLTWDEAVERELSFGPLALTELLAGQIIPIVVDGGIDVEDVDGGRLVRSRRHLTSELTLSGEPDGGLLQVSLAVHNTGAPPADKDDAIAASLSATGARPVNALADPHHLADSDPPWAGGDRLRIRRFARALTPGIAGPALGLVDAVPRPVAGALRTGLDMLAGLTPKGSPA